MSRREYGWNDPPQFSYEQGGRGGATSYNKLNKRPTYPADKIPPNSTTKSEPLRHDLPPPSSLPPSLPPPTSSSSLSPPTSSSSLPPPTSSSSLPPPPTSSLPSSSLPLPPPISSSIKDTLTTPITSEQENIIPILQSHVMTPLYELVERHKDKIEERVYKEIKKRLDILDKQWDTLSLPVHQRLNQLVTALKENDFKRAESIHIALMVDHVTEVKQWLIGVKKLVTIATEQYSLN